MKFIYVVSREDATKLARIGFAMLKEDLKNNIWVFAPSKQYVEFNKLQFILDESEILYTLSNTLTF